MSVQRFYNGVLIRHGAERPGHGEYTSAVLDDGIQHCPPPLPPSSPKKVSLARRMVFGCRTNRWYMQSLSYDMVSKLSR